MYFIFAIDLIMMLSSADISSYQ